MSRWLLCCLILASALVGCTTTTMLDPSEAPEMIIIREYTPFYRIGPQQVRGPDEVLGVNDRVLLLRKELGFSFVQLETGRTGYVANESLAVAPPRPKPSPTPKPQRTSSTRSSGSSSGSSSRSYPNFSTEDIPSPDFSLPVEEELIDLAPNEPLVSPTPTPEPAKPRFRY